MGALLLRFSPSSDEGIAARLLRFDPSSQGLAALLLRPPLVEGVDVGIGRRLGRVGHGRSPVPQLDHLRRLATGKVFDVIGPLLQGDGHFVVKLVGLVDAGEAAKDAAAVVQRALNRFGADASRCMPDAQERRRSCKRQLSSAMPARSLSRLFAFAHPMMPVRPSSVNT
jgi:hypothetical protein